MICQCWLLLVIIYASNVHSSPQWIGGQIYRTPDAYQTQKNPLTSRYMSDVPTEPDAAKPATRIENVEKPNNFSKQGSSNQHLPPSSPSDQRPPSNQQGKQSDEMQTDWQEQIAQSFSCL